MNTVSKGSRHSLVGTRFRVSISAAQPDAIDLIAVLLTSSGTVRSDDDLVFFNNPRVSGVELLPDGTFGIDLSSVPSDADRVVVAASTEAQSTDFGHVSKLSVFVSGQRGDICFEPAGLASETLVQLVAFYRRGGEWKLDVIGQGYDAGLAAFATECGITVDDGPAPATPRAQMAPPPTAPPPRTTPAGDPPKASPVAASPISMQKVRISITKDSASKTATIDLRKAQGDPSWVLTVGLEWDGRGAVYASDGSVKKFGDGDLDVYFFCRNEQTDEFVVLSGEKGARAASTGGRSSSITATARGPVVASGRLSNRSQCVHRRTETSWSMCTSRLTTARGRSISSAGRAR
ncbi:TerD family protein [Tsukamurella sp. PLM1]|uniref:TerD family protein n=1 Tax=Tsukamurella sp. PLM1 TaxID=2929795 RepID=UPI0020BF8B59|nr:TerD family protein [Tsukamurella sp. PLM1]